MDNNLTDLVINGVLSHRLAVLRRFYRREEYQAIGCPLMLDSRSALWISGDAPLQRLKYILNPRVFSD